jgi:fructoselysine-6-P-deglycase FrlB-like protein
MGKPFSTEIAALPETIRWARSQDVTLFRRTVSGASDKSLIVVGSGGSFSAAAYIAQLHEHAFRRVSRPSTPLEYALRRNELPYCATALVSAEGKNKDILAAAEVMSSSHSTGLALSLTSSNPLVNFCHDTGAATNVCFDVPWGKDGYLATNSLIATMALAARTYSDKHVDEALRELDEHWFHSRRKKISETDVLKMLVPSRQLLVLFGSVGRIAAIDIESKFAEGALGPCQIVDYRQFAHGRHLQLDRLQQPFVIAFDSDVDRKLTDEMLALMPQDIPVLRLTLPSNPILAEICGVIDGLLITELIGVQRNIDVGKPNVPQFGKDIYALDMRAAYPERDDALPLALARKFPLRGPAQSEWDAWEKAALTFCDRLASARFKALVCDFDGTCCDTDRRFDGLDVRLKSGLERLISEGTAIGFATGRGDSLHNDLQQKLDRACWPKVIIGYYTGSVIQPLSAHVQESPADQRLERLSGWLAGHGLLDQIGSTPKLSGGQLSLRVENHAAKGRTIAAINHWINEKNEYGWRVYCSGHSIDVLTNKVGKRLVVDELARIAGANPNDEILRIGDSGDFEGNDFELLNTGLGLSVAAVSPFADSCWNFLPKNRRGSVGTHYYLSSLEPENGSMRFTAEFIERAYQICSTKRRQA